MDSKKNFIAASSFKGSYLGVGVLGSGTDAGIADAFGHEVNGKWNGFWNVRWQSWWLLVRRAVSVELGSLDGWLTLFVAPYERVSVRASSVDGVRFKHLPEQQFPELWV